MIPRDELWDDPTGPLEDADEPTPTLRIVRAPKESADERLARDARALEAEFRRIYPDTNHETKEAA